MSHNGQDCKYCFTTPENASLVLCNAICGKCGIYYGDGHITALIGDAAVCGKKCRACIGEGLWNYLFDDGSAAGLEVMRNHNFAGCPDPECSICAVLDCPSEDPLHGHHDGCPSCWHAEQGLAPAPSMFSVVV